MRKKATITPKRKAKALSDEALAVSADKLLNVLSKNTQETEQKVYCGKCKYMKDGYTTRSPVQCTHPNSVWVHEYDTPVMPVKTEMMRTCSERNYHNNCIDFEQIAYTPPSPELSNVRLVSVTKPRESLWSRFKKLIS